MAETALGADWPSLVTHARSLGVDLSEAQVAALRGYLDRLCEWNQRFNLTAIERPDEILRKHFLDSLTCSLAADLPHARSLVDVGTGAGFPGLVLKIAFPHLAVTLLDAVRKRLGFIDRVVSDLELTGVYTVHARAEDAARFQAAPGTGPRGARPGSPCLRERFDVVTARAVARLNVLTEWTLPLARVGGHVLAMKGPAVQSEVDEARRAMRLLGGGEPVVREFLLPGTDAGRSLVLIPKVRPTPGAYPRRPGIVREMPL